MQIILVTLALIAYGLIVGIALLTDRNKDVWISIALGIPIGVVLTQLLLIITK